MSDGEPTVFDIFKNFWIFLKQYVARADGFCLLTLTVLGSYYITILTGPITYILFDFFSWLNQLYIPKYWTISIKIHCMGVLRFDQHDPT